jgi:hypothetical protein
VAKVIVVLRVAWVETHRFSVSRLRLDVHPSAVEYAALFSVGRGDYWVRLRGFLAGPLFLGAILNHAFSP